MKQPAHIVPLQASTLFDGNESGGFRLRRFEVLNWGTFHKQVWGLDLGGENTLLTGDIGSGKSTLVDAITTLLVPPQKINYNKAAGADEKERTPRSYMLGQYRKERSDENLSVRALSLRDHNSYSAILGHFHNDALQQSVTLAIVLWMKDLQGQPARLYIVADTRLSIQEHIAGFGKEVAQLKKRLRGIPGVELHEAFSAYSAGYRRLFGIESEQALDLFHQTVSMKSVGNLTDFVREHMLQPFGVEERIEALVSHFDDLQRAHESVVKAKRQIGMLTPIVEDCAERATLAEQTAALRESRELLHAWMCSQTEPLLRERLRDLGLQLERAMRAKVSGEEERAKGTAERDSIQRDISRSGGDRIEVLKHQAAAKQVEKEARQRRAQQYQNSAAAAGLPALLDSDRFAANRQDALAAVDLLAQREAELQNARADAEYTFRTERERLADVEAELKSLRKRRSNIPRQSLEIRERLCAALGLKEEALPFVGELIEVRPEESKWEGALERLLHNFGLSLLVPDARYETVAQWVDQNHLSGRLVYYRVQPQAVPGRSAARSTEILAKLNLKADSHFHGWLDAQLVQRYTHACCETMERFRREQTALSLFGQIKDSNNRHEKDDRSRIDDRSRYVLGWSNASKIAALERDTHAMQAKIQSAASLLAQIQTELKSLKARADALRGLLLFETFADLDWKTVAIDIERIEKERRELESGSDVLRILQKRLAETEESLSQLQKDLDALNTESANLTFRTSQATALLQANLDSVAAVPEARRKQYFGTIQQMSGEALAGKRITVEWADARERDVREWLQAKIDAELARITRLDGRIVKAMQAFRDHFRQETAEVDASVEAADEYGKMLRDLQSDDLPRFEARFKELLNENTIREVANFQSQLNRERQSIRERIDTINHSLRGIDYNRGRYILLEVDATTDTEIRQFQTDLRGCTEGALTGSEDEQYSETKFLQVKAIIERFRGRENYAEIDRRWTRKVTDVRQWFAFSASERYREDNREFEHYTDSGGKSGGQKEKLAYTILAASLAYQFGLERGASRSRSFRFVVIDEAFGRGSDESTRYGLQLFSELGLQLLVVTPLQKIHVIEPFVSSVGFVHIEDSSVSMLRNLTIEEYLKERAARSA